MDVRISSIIDPFLFEVDYLKYMANGVSGSASIVTEYTKKNRLRGKKWDL